MIRRTIQTVSLLAFLGLLAAAVLTAADATLFTFVLGLDPALSLPTAVGARTIVPALLPAVVLLAIGPLIGRGFCGWLCPMGTTVDGLDAVARRRAPGRRTGGTARRLKYAVLGALLGAALLGLSLVHLGSPMALMTRLYGLLLYPLLAIVADGALNLVRPLAGLVDLHAITFATVRTPAFDTTLFLLVLAGGLVAAAVAAPRLWCRFLCPAGAMLALVAWRPLIRRRVDRRCGSCALCADVCPVGAIDVADFRVTRHEECLLCGTCQDICPKSSVTFLTGDDEVEGRTPAFIEARRHLLVGGLAGFGVAAFGLSGVVAAPVSAAAAPVRPPGAVPEADYLSRCVRCEACVAACPTNALQPLYAARGLAGVFAPGLVPAGGPCDPHCARCGEVCPTGAIRELAGDERLWAKTGTAEIDLARCIAWADGERCMVCDEVCPFDAVVFRLEADRPVAVPHVEAARCAGCGYCENACPVKRPAAIRVRPRDALRLATGSYVAEGRRRGLDIALETQRPTDAAPTGGVEGVAPGFDRLAP